MGGLSVYGVLNRRHAGAAFSALSAGGSTLVHVAEGFTADGAGFANLCAQCAQLGYKLRTTELEVGRGLADFRTVEHQREMLGLYVLSAKLQAVRHGGLQADLMIFGTGLDAGLHACNCVVHGVVLRYK